MMGERLAMDSLECDCCFAVGVLYMMGEGLAWIALGNVTGCRWINLKSLEMGVTPPHLRM